MYGFIFQALEDAHYLLGGNDPLAQYPLLLPDGHGWQPFLPTPEVQYRGNFESENCTNYGTNHCLATLAKFKGYDEFPKDCSERYGGIETGTTRQGNNAHFVIEKIRTDIGVIPELSLPFNDSITTWDEYYSPKPTGLVPFGRRILSKFKIGHRWVFNDQNWSEDKPDKLKHALQYSPIGISVSAWEMRGDKFCKADTDPDNHWCMLFDYKDQDYWLVFDSYDQSIKKLEWHYNFFSAKNYFIDKIPFTVPQDSWSKFWDKVWQLFKLNHLLGRDV